MLQKPRLPAITFGRHSSTERYWQSHMTLPRPVFTTAHQGPSPYARLAGTSKHNPATSAAVANSSRVIAFRVISVIPRLAATETTVFEPNMFRPCP
jgi:hypothetical protein